MGYTTKFEGCFTLDKPLAPEHAAYLKAFNATRRMKRDQFKAAELPDPIRDAAGLPLGSRTVPVTTLVAALAAVGSSKIEAAIQWFIGVSPGGEWALGIRR